MRLFGKKKKKLDDENEFEEEEELSRKGSYQRRLVKDKDFKDLKRENRKKRKGARELKIRLLD